MTDPIELRVHERGNAAWQTYAFWCVPSVGAVLDLGGREVVVVSCYLRLYIPNVAEITVEDVKEYG